MHGALSRPTLFFRVALVALACLVAAPAAANALPGASISAKKSKLVKRVEYPGIQHLHYEYGPIEITPGQNNIEFHLNRQKPTVPGYITRFKPNLVYSGTKKVPRVDVIHLHHGVWLAKGYPTFAAGEEKTTFQLPRGYGYHYSPSDTLDHELHDPQPDAAPDEGVDHLRHRLRPGLHGGGEVDHARPSRSGWTSPA